MIRPTGSLSPRLALHLGFLVVFAVGGCGGSDASTGDGPGGSGGAGGSTNSETAAPGDGAEASADVAASDGPADLAAAGPDAGTADGSGSGGASADAGDAGSGGTTMIDGSAVDGSAVDGSAVDGSATDGSVTDGADASTPICQAGEDCTGTYTCTASRCRRNQEEICHCVNNLLFCGPSPCFPDAGAADTGWDPLESTCRHASLSIL